MNNEHPLEQAALQLAAAVNASAAVMCDLAAAFALPAPGMTPTLQRCMRLLDRYLAGQLDLAQLRRLWRAILAEEIV